ncbi:phosphopantetheine-binding protein [Actinomadura sp. 7K534]|uniref:acyl carrier protein n=1 Tax=Actinomadura sp. 7K534 TaxID=2530366 RepID=UPI00105136CC|nr:phosphopantetheine-binding protein [Actinomadura sp. 7K534]TDB96152.1 acyl carrier protein [Actinomadura sp. 7K534]
MNTIDDFVALVRDHLGLPVTAEDAERTLDQVPGWDSMHLLWVLTTIERETGRSVPLPDLLQATSLHEMYLLAVDR